MRRIVMYNWVTADGYFVGRSGDLDWVVPDEERAKMAAKNISSFDTVLFGRWMHSRSVPFACQRR